MTTRSGSTTKRKRKKKAPAKPSMKWVSLHNHTTFSYGDGFGPVASHADRVDELGMTAVAATEHGNCSSHAQLEKECAKRNLKPIYGIEAYCGPTDPDDPWRSQKGMKWHLIILAMNQTGYVNLCRIVTASWRDNHNSRYPTVSSAMLKKWSEGLIILSGCSDSHLSTTLLGGKSLGPKRETYTEEDYQNAKKVALWYRSVFGDRYYIEVQRFPGLQRTCTLNPAFERISVETGIPMVATADVHYPLPSQNKMQSILHSAHRGKTVYQSEASWEYDILLTYPTSDQEIFEDLMGTGLSSESARQAILTTADIAERCNVVLPKNEPIKWDFTGYDSIEDYIWQKLRDGWDFRAEYNENMPGKEEAYVARLRHEMGMIVEKDFCHYFAMVAYLLVWAKEQKIAIGPARGSAAASLVCYLLRITEIDPMQFPTMLFSRFIDPNRFDLPDIDVDVQDDRRHEVIEEARRVFGSDRVANIGNFIKYRGKNSIDDVTRVYRLPEAKAEDLKKLIVDRSGGDARQDDSLADTFAMFPKAREILKEFPKFKLATRLEGNYRGLGKHAAGLVISNAPIDETCAVYEIPGEMDAVVAYDKKDADYVGMLKMDLLGLKTMGMIGIALDTIGMDLEELYRVPITEERTLRAFYENDLNGIFQFEGRATAIVNNDVKPTTFQQLADINALSRPGPLFSGMEAQYVAVKHGYEPAEKLHPVVDALTDWTYGQIVYQEQVLSILAELAGFSAIRVGDIRRIISQKSGMMAMQNAYQEFEDGCRTKHGIKSPLAKKIWNFIATSSTYSFNQSHSVSYAMLAFWCVAGTTRVYAWDEQRYMRIDQAMRAGVKGLACYDHETGKTIRGEVGSIYQTGVKNTYTMRTKSAKKLRCTMEHLILTPNGYVPLRDLNPGDMVASEKRVSVANRPDVAAKISLGSQAAWDKVSSEDKIARTTAARAAQDPSGRWPKMSESAKEAKSRQWMKAKAVAAGHYLLGSCGEYCYGANEIPVCEWLTENEIDHQHQPHVGNGKIADFFAKGTFIEVTQYENSKAIQYQEQYKDLLFQPVTVKNFIDELSWMLEEEAMRNGEEVTFEPIVSIDFWKTEMTYDITMEDENHNFLANGVVVHNCMYLKQYHPTAFYGAQLTKVGDGKAVLWKRGRLMADAMRGNEATGRIPVSVQAPDLNLSGLNWTADLSTQSVKAGFMQVHGVGPAKAHAILDWRTKKQEQHALLESSGTSTKPLNLSWDQLTEVYGIGPGIQAKITAFVEKDDPFDIELTGRVLTSYRQRLQLLGREAGIRIPAPTHHSTQLPDTGTHKVVWIGMARKKNQKDAVEAERARTGREEEEILSTLKDPHLRKSCVIQAYDEGEEDVYLRISRWNYPELESDIEDLQLNSDVVIIAGTKREGFGKSINVTHMWVIDTSGDEESEDDDELGREALGQGR